MLIQGNYSFYKTNFLINKYKELISMGESPENILVIVLNSYKKNEFIKSIKSMYPEFDVEKNNIYTFFGLCYNAFKDNWEEILKLIENGNNANKPNLCGLEVSQFIFKQSIHEADFSDYISKVNLLQQLFRRYSLIVQNSLNNNEIKERSLMLGESFYIDAQKAIDDYKLKTIQYKSFDYLRQLAVFPYIYKHTNYFKDIKYIFIDDADEFSYAFWLFIETIYPQLKEFFIAYDPKGSTRCGYLCAYKSGVNNFIKKYNPQVIKIKEEPKFFELAESFFENIKNTKKTKLANINYFSSIKRLDMIQNAIQYINKLVNSGINPSEISVITPIIDNIFKESFKSNFSKCSYQILSGNEKLINNENIKNCIIILKLINNISVKENNLKSLLINFLKIPYKKCSIIITEYLKIKKLINYDFNQESYNFALNKLLSVISSLKESKQSISSQIKIIYENLIKDFDTDINKEKFNFLIKEAESFEKAFQDNFKDLTEQFIIQIENSVISENPSDSIYINKDSIIVSSPQKIIDLSIETKYQIWLDISNNEWIKQDTGTLYNAWVMNRDWEGNKYTLEDSIKHTRDKAARVIRKLMLLAKDNIIFFSSLYDNNGNENFGAIEEFIEINHQEKQNIQIIPREDQKPVLEYKKGKMGIMAVPGAGKTTILLALIIKLINEGISPQNIFVLTYMESAAKNFKERIKSSMNENSELPNISTIHGLALRIIKENANYVKVGLDEDFEICDDNTKEKIAKDLFYKFKIDEDKYENYIKCISIVKQAVIENELASKYKDIQDFYKFFSEYNNTLKKNNLIDYDDMLAYALKILCENKEILSYYQNLCRYIIEDEAQDSSSIQQRLISKLSGKYNNIVRCGDINQAITSTFTNSDLKSFKEFINKNNKVEMISSQRCSKPIYTLANTIIKKSLCNEETRNAFYPIEMQGTNKNPISENNPQYLFFKTDKEEKNYIINNIREIIKTDSSASIAVLLRLNSQVNDYNEMFLSQGIKTSVRTDCLLQRKIYKLIDSLLRVIESPINNEKILNLAQIYNQNRIYNFTIEDFDYIKKLTKPFINLSCDDIQSEGLLQLYWDIDYWLNNSSKEINMLVLDIGLYYAKNNIDKTNAYIISTLIMRLIGNSKDITLTKIIEQFEYSAQKPLTFYKFFEDENEIENDITVNIMTMHKSKGDEFDYVFIPEFNENNYPLSIKNTKLKSGGHFIQTIKKSVENTQLKSPEELKKEQIEENLRLLYVGATRAKKSIIFTTSEQNRKNKNCKNSDFLFNIIS